MNATIEKIVNLLFEDLVETEETAAIREEILQNCQERFSDLCEAGISEDDAIHAVIESLNGMEEMLSEYPRKAAVSDDKPEKTEIPEPAEVEDENDSRSWSCDPAQSPIREIRMEHMASADVQVCVSQDHLVHVECSNPELTLMTGLENGVLTIALSDLSPGEAQDEIKFSLQDGFDLSSIGRLFEKLAKKFVIINNMKGGAEITLALPKGLCPALQIGTSSGNVTVEPWHLESLCIGTASGDVELDSLSINTELRVVSASGDITLSGVQAKQVQLSSTSGDVEAHACTAAESVRLNTTSGDIEWQGDCRSLNATSISGDITQQGSTENVTFRTVSGDVEADLTAGGLLSLSGSTTSGDMDVRLPADLQVDLQLSMVSSHISTRVNHVPGAPVVVKLSTVSGDIEVN